MAHGCKTSSWCPCLYIPPQAASLGFEAVLLSPGGGLMLPIDAHNVRHEEHLSVHHHEPLVLPSSLALTLLFTASALQAVPQVQCQSDWF